MDAMEIIWTVFLVYATWVGAGIAMTILIVTGVIGFIWFIGRK